MLYFCFLPVKVIEFITRIQLLTVWFKSQKLAFDYAIKCDLGR